MILEIKLPGLGAARNMGKRVREISGMTTTCLNNWVGEGKGKQEEFMNSDGLNSETLNEHVNEALGIRFEI